jgi:hypothetical protein
MAIERVFCSELVSLPEERKHHLFTVDNRSMTFIAALRFHSDFALHPRHCRFPVMRRSSTIFGASSTRLATC